MAYGAETMSLVEVGLSSPHCIHFNEISNDKLRRFELDFLKEMGGGSQAKLAMY